MSKASKKRNKILGYKQLRTSNDISDIETFFIDARGEIDKKIKTMVNDAEILKILERGKRLRSLLAYLSFKACTTGKETSRQYQRALEGSVSIELAHGASLVHDDIIDKDVVRRGKPAFHVKEGISKALLVGHKMLANGFDIALSHGKEVAKLYVDSWDEVVSGEIYEVDFNKKNNVENADISKKEKFFQDYDNIINLKTAGLFSSACRVGALEANMSGDILNVFSDYGREIGLAYQLADDFVDLVHGEIIDSVVVPLLGRLENKPIVGVLKKREIRKMFLRNEEKIKQYYLGEIKRHVERAEELSGSDLIPSSNYKDLMFKAPKYIINKMLDELNISV